MNEYVKNPKETLKSLKIYRSIIQKQMLFFPLSWELLRNESRKLIAVLDIYINDYEEFFKNRKLKQEFKQQQLFFEDNILK